MKKLPTTFTNKKYRYTYMLFSLLTSFVPRLYGKKLVSGRRIALPAESTWAKLTTLSYNQANRAGVGSADRVDPAMPAQVFIMEKSWPG